MNLKNLPFFHAVVVSGGISKASRLLQQSQPNISRAIKSLEIEIGHVLLLRSKRGISLRPKGHEVFQISKRYVAMTRQVQDELVESEPKLSVGASENLVLY